MIRKDLVFVNLRVKTEKVYFEKERTSEKAEVFYRYYYPGDINFFCNFIKTCYKIENNFSATCDSIRILNIYLKIDILSRLCNIVNFT